MPSKPVFVREPARVRRIVEALGVDGQPSVVCPPDYASAELGLLLSGRDVYARRNIYVWGLFVDAVEPDAADGARPPNVVVVSSSGCRGGPPGDTVALRRELAAVGGR